VAVPARDPGAPAPGATRWSRWCAESNEDLIETFFEKGTLAQEDLVRGLRKAVLQGRLFPCSRVVPAQRRRHPLLGRDRGPAALPTDRGEAAGPIPRARKRRGSPRRTARCRATSSRRSPIRTPAASACSGCTPGR
jgi:hypothetical protein